MVETFNNSLKRILNIICEENFNLDVVAFFIDHSIKRIGIVVLLDVAPAQSLESLKNTLETLEGISSRFVIKSIGEIPAGTGVLTHGVVLINKHMKKFINVGIDEETLIKLDEIAKMDDKSIKLWFKLQ